ncbi:fused MFS/spermidine synthase [bacterium]|nr:fused MFS/spermidine synthase [bacterium]
MDQHKFFRLISLLFFVSGTVALGYQVTWSKFLLDFIGASSYSYATVLSTFMAGLALGSWFIGKYADRLENPLKIYAYLELAVGLYALAYVQLTDVAAGIYGNYATMTPGHSSGATRTFLKIILSSVLLILPCALMGGTYPLLLRAVSFNLKLVGRRASQLYSANAAGAVGGILFITFIVLPSVGLNASVKLLAIGNAFIALVALFLSKYAESPKIPEEAVSEPVMKLSPQQIRMCLLLILVEGVLAFLYEIAWTRFFGVVLGSSTYSFAIMLAAFITGISLGSALLSRYEARIKNVFFFFGSTQLATAGTVAALLPFYPFVVWVFEQWGSLFSTQPLAFYPYEAGKLLICYVVMLVPTIFIGMALPLLVKLVNDQLSTVGYRSGLVYSANTIGNVIGALLGGLLLLPMFGMQRLLAGTTVATAILGIYALHLAKEKESKTSFIRLASSLVVALAVFFLLSGSWKREWFTQIPFRRDDQAHNLAEKRRMIDQYEVLYFEDDPAGHLLVARTKYLKPEARTLYINGKADASSSADLPTQILSAHIPLLLHPAPEDVLVIGLASGVTAGSALTHEQVKSVNAVDLIQSMPEATRFYTKWNNNVLTNSKFHFIADDARSYVRYAGKRYDVIISEPSNPWTAGTGSLFSVEYYSDIRKILKPSGLFLQWIQIYEISDPTFVAVLRTLHTNFPFIYGFQGAARDLLLLGTSQPLKVDSDQLQMRMDSPRIRQDLTRVHLSDPSEFLFLQKFSPATIHVLSSFTEQENNAENRFLEYQAPHDYFEQQSPTLTELYDERLTNPKDLLRSQLNYANQEVRPQIASAFVETGMTRPLESRVLSDKLLNLALPPAIIPSFLWIDDAQTESIVQSLDRLVTEKQEEAFEKRISQFSSAILLSCVRSKEHSELWIEKTRVWAHAQPMWSRARTFFIEVLKASGQNRVAASELWKCVTETNLLKPEWAILKSLQLQEPGLTSGLMQYYRQKNPENLFVQIYYQDNYAR